MLDDIVFFDTLREALWIAVGMSTPILGVALAAGLLVGLLQALTSVQEMTLTFVPKLLAMLIVFWGTMTYMTNALTSFFHGRLLPLAAGV